VTHHITARFATATGSLTRELKRMAEELRGFVDGVGQSICTTMAAVYCVCWLVTI
jgi:Na+/H+ antiporter NhaC